MFKYQLLKEPRSHLQGVLLYRGNIFVRRLEMPSPLGKRTHEQRDSFHTNGIVRLAKKVSQTTIIKDDFLDHEQVRLVAQALIEV
jgi:hypothetical protein